MGQVSLMLIALSKVVRDECSSNCPLGTLSVLFPATIVKRHVDVETQRIHTDPDQHHDRIDPLSGSL